MRKNNTVSVRNLKKGSEKNECCGDLKSSFHRYDCSLSKIPNKNMECKKKVGHPPPPPAPPPPHSPPS